MVFQKGHKTWNKGLKGFVSVDRKNKTYVELYGEKKAKKIKENQRKSHVGKKLSEEHREHMSISAKKSINSGRFVKGHTRTPKGTNHGNGYKKGHKCYPIRDKEAHYNKLKPYFFKKGNNIRNTGRTRFKEGEECVNWRGGISFEPYGIEFNDKLREQIRRRDNYRCQECFRHQNELITKNNRKYKLNIHHIDFNKKNNNPDNLISLCRNCHTQTNFDREEWIEYFQNRLNGII